MVHEIRLTINTKDWQSLQIHYLDNTYYPCDFRWRDQVVRNIGIRSRGNGSRSAVKPGLRVDFDRYVTDQQFLGLKSFVFRNNTQDASSMHERLSMLLFRRLGLPASREAHAKLFINNEYHGLYLIEESVDKTFLQETFNENDGYLYKYRVPVGVPAVLLRGPGSDPGAYVPLPFKPETHETDPRPEFIVQLVQAINQTGDVAFRTVMAEYLDLKKFVRHVAVETFVADNDGFLSDYGGMNNYYLYRFRIRSCSRSSPGTRARRSRAATSPTSSTTSRTGPTRQNRLMMRALAYPDLYNAYLDALLDCARSAAETAPGVTGGPGWLEREVQREYQQIRDAALADPSKPFTNDEFERAANDLGVFARRRGDFVAAAVNAARAR